MSVDFYDLFNKPPTEARPTNITPLDPARASRYATKALRSECENVAAAPEGTRNHTLNTAAFSISQLVAAGHLGHQDAWDALSDAGRACGLPDDEVQRTLASGFKAGSQTPRVVADLPELPVPVMLVDSPEDVGPPLNPIIDWHELYARESEGEEWIIEPILPARRMVALYSAPKVGKSLLMLEIAAAMARGTEVIGTKVDRPYRVLYIDFENDPEGDILTRLEAMDVAAGDLENLCYLSFPSLAKFDTAQGALDLMRHVEHYDCEVVVIDTVSRAVAGEENDNDTWLAFYRNAGLAMKQRGVACIRLDHSGKDREKGMRGGSAKYGDVDAVWKLTADSETVLNLDCTDHRMPIEQDHLTIVRDSHPALHHRLVGDRLMALDYREQEIDKEIDKLGIDTSQASANETYKRLREAGKGFNKQSVLRVVKARKLRLTQSSSGGSGTTLEPPGTTPGGSGSRSPLRSRAPEPPPGNRFPEPEPPLPVGGEDLDESVSCKACHKPTTNGVARKNDGLCATCARTAGMEE